MQLDVISYFDLLNSDNQNASQKLENALLQKGVVGIKDVPEFEEKSRAFIQAAQHFSQLETQIKQQYTPDRDTGKTEGYELGAEWFKDSNGTWQIDDKKASYYAYVPEDTKNVWPNETDLRTPYLELGELMFNTGKLLLSAIGLNTAIGLNHDGLVGYGRMLHYHKESDITNINPNWCGAHLDHGVFTGLMPAYYFQNGKEVEEPTDAGLYIQPSDSDEFVKVNATDKSVLLFQVGEFGQLISNDKIKATRHLVKKAKGEIERFAFALFYNAADETLIQSSSTLINDARYQLNQSNDGFLTYAKWQEASYARYRAMQGK